LKRHIAGQDMFSPPFAEHGEISVSGAVLRGLRHNLLPMR